LTLIRDYTIADISLDITPAFKPGTTADYTGLGAGDTSEDDDILDDRKLEDSPVRSWRDRSGRLVGHGRFADFKNDEIHVEATDGSRFTIPYVNLGSDELCFVGAWWNIPNECRLDDSGTVSRAWQPTTFTWIASSLCHKPLYFEDVQLERYGHSAGPLKQPVLSAAHFFGSAIFLPYKIGLHPPNECIYTLGYYRPGSCAPWTIPAVPLSLRGLYYQTSAAIGLSAIIP
jgi:hypothetical protein